MSDRDELDRRLASWMGEIASTPPTRASRASAIDAAVRPRPLPRWRAGLGSDWIEDSRVGPGWLALPEPPSMPAAMIVLALLLVAALAVAALLIGALSMRPPLPSWALGGLAYAIDGDIYLAQPDGSSPVRIADGNPTSDTPPDYYGPRWSPDGQYLLFLEARPDRTPGGDPFDIADAQGRRIGSFLLGGDPTWSPDSSRIVTRRPLHGPAGEPPPQTFDVYSVDGRLLETVTLPDGLVSNPGSLGWTPDGSAIVVPNVWAYSQDAGRAATWLLPLDGEPARPLTADVETPQVETAFSPDGTQVAISATRGLYVAAADGTRPRPLASLQAADFGYGRPVWSPRGDRIALLRRSGADGVPPTLVVVDVATGSSVDVGSTWDDPRWSPDGRRLLAPVFDRDRLLSSLVDFAADGSGRTVVVQGANSGDWRWVPRTPLATPSPTPVPRLGHLAYGLDGDMYVANWDGTNPVRTADGLPGGKSGCGPAGYWGEGRIWSPDGRHLAYRGGFDQVSCPSGHGMVYVSDLDGTHLVSFPGDGWHIAWSPDSTRVATWTDLGPPRTLGVFGLDGSRKALIQLPLGILEPGDFDPTWASDGRLLVPCFPVCEQPLDGGPPHVLPASDPYFYDRYAAISPDGSEVAYITSGSLVVSARDGSQRRVVVEAGVEHVVWSPVGDRVAITADTGVTTDQGPQSVVRLVDVESASSTTVAGGSGGDSFRVITFSPEGDRLLFVRTDATGRESLWSVAADGSDLRLLVNGTGWGDWQTVSGGG